ncbi:hypothetical protein ZOSMA_7G01890 [Zostera marina]|uniref:Uncharacterized protein n=1 Tax=Zostera marina TaxID=29655 RepID=A0A0K9NN39_ZOSMR|nr:hypothetical protein ZOSMA_7G01890 [Zostera marina]
MARFSSVATTLFFLIAMAVVSSAQVETLAPAPSPDAGSAYGVAASGVMMICSFVLSFVLLSSQ